MQNLTGRQKADKTRQHRGVPGMETSPASRIAFIQRRNTMQRQLNIRTPAFINNFPLLDSEFDVIPEETFVSIMAQAEFNDAEYKLSKLS